MTKHIYVDANGTYPVAPKHYDDIATRLKLVDGNPSSIHAPGRNAKIALEEARTAVAKLIGANAQEIIFTSGATEANNMVLSGISSMDKNRPPPQIIVTAAEHSAVIETAKALAHRGLCDLAIAPVLPSGAVDSQQLLTMVTSDTALVALIAANNETGVLNPLMELTAQIKKCNPLTHVHADAVQLLGKVDLTWLGQSGVNSAAFSGHKLGAFKGTGALFLKRGTKLHPFVTGGGQERGRRAGTENIPGIVSFGLKCAETLGQEVAHATVMRLLRDQWIKVLDEIPGAVVHGMGTDRLPNTVNFHIDGIAGDDILLNFDLANIYASSGSACSSSVARPSHVLLAMGYSEWIALNSVRISFTADNEAGDIALMARVLQQVIERK